VNTVEEKTMSAVPKASVVAVIGYQILRNAFILKERGLYSESDVTKVSDEVITATDNLDNIRLKMDIKWEELTVLKEAGQRLVNQIFELALKLNVTVKEDHPLV